MQTKDDKDKNVDESTLTSQFPLNLQWYSERDYFGNNHREPCVNLYLGEKDEFEVHHDGGAVTILLALSDYPEDYQGGGTEFFGPDKLRARKTFDHTGSDHNVLLQKRIVTMIPTVKLATNMLSQQRVEMYWYAPKQEPQ